MTKASQDTVVSSQFFCHLLKPNVASHFLRISMADNNAIRTQMLVRNIANFMCFLEWILPSYFCIID